MPATASIIIEVNEAGVTQAFQRVNAEAGKIGPTLQPVQRISEQAFNNIEGGALRAREAAALLGEEFGVKVPRALRGVLAESKGIGPALTTAFSGLAVIGFVDIAEHAGEALAKFVEKIAGWGDVVKETMNAQIALNKVIVDSNDKIDKLDNAYRLIGLQGLEQFREKQKLAGEDVGAAKDGVAKLTEELKKLQRQAQETHTVQIFDPGTGGVSGETSEPTAAAQAANSQIQEVTNRLADAQQHAKELGAELRNAGKEVVVAFSKDRADGIREIGTAAQEALAKIQGMIGAAGKEGATAGDKIHDDLVAKQEELAKFLVLEGSEPGIREAVAKASVAIEHGAAQAEIKLLEEEWAKKSRIIESGIEEEDKALHAQAEKQRRMEDETLNIEKSSAVASAPPWARAQISIIASYQERMDKIREMLNTGDLDEAHAARQQAASWNEAFGQMRDNLASQMQGLFDDMTSGNIGKRFKKMFEDMVFQMVATWVLGMQGMRAASAGAMGQGPGGILGALFGLGGGSGGGIFGGSSVPGGTPPFLGGGILNLLGGSSAAGGGGIASGLSGLDNLPLFSGSQAGGAFSLFGLGLSAGGGTAMPGMVLPSGAGPKPGGLLGMLSGGGLGGLFGLAAMGGGALLGSGNTILKSIGGLLLGGGLGAGIAATIAGTSIGSALGAFGALLGPIGALAGFLIPLIMGLFGPHKGDIARVQVMEPLMAQIKTIKDSYDVFQTDYNTGVGELETLRSQAIANLKKIGGRQVSGNTTSTNRLVDQAEAYLKTTEAERARRAQLQFGPAQFHSGGFVDPSLAGVPSGWSGITMHSGGEVPAILESGEYVIRQSTVNRVGRGNLDRMNAGGGAGGGPHFHISVNAMDAKSFERWLDAGGIDALMRSVQRGQVEGRF